MKRIRSFFAIGAFALAVLILPSAASAQWGGRNDDFARVSIRGTVINLQNAARSFDRQVSAIDNRRDDRNNRYDRIDSLDRLSNQFKNAAENLADEIGRGRNGMNGSRDEAQRVLVLGSQIDRMLGNSRNTRNYNRAALQAHWTRIERDLQTIARAYGLSYNGRNVRGRLPY